MRFTKYILSTLLVVILLIPVLASARRPGVSGVTAIGGGAAGSGAGAIPAAIWAIDENGRYSDTGKTTIQTTDNGVVRAWEDQIGSLDMVQATSNIPTLDSTNTSNGINSIDYNPSASERHGAGDAALMEFDRTDPFSFSIVLRRESGAGWPFGKMDAAGQGWHLGGIGNKYQFHFGSDTTNRILIPTVEDATVGSVMILIVSYDGSEAASGVAFGGDFSKDTPTHDALSGTVIGAAEFTAGAIDNSAVVLFDGQIFEARVWDVALDANQIAAEDSRLRTKYGL